MSPILIRVCIVALFVLATSLPPTHSSSSELPKGVSVTSASHQQPNPSWLLAPELGTPKCPSEGAGSSETAPSEFPAGCFWCKPKYSWWYLLGTLQPPKQRAAQRGRLATPPAKVGAESLCLSDARCDCGRSSVSPAYRVGEGQGTVL